MMRSVALDDQLLKEYTIHRKLLYFDVCDKWWNKFWAKETEHYEEKKKSIFQIIWITKALKFKASILKSLDDGSIFIDLLQTK